MKHVPSTGQSGQLRLTIHLVLPHFGRKAAGRDSVLTKQRFVVAGQEQRLTPLMLLAPLWLGQSQEPVAVQERWPLFWGDGYATSLIDPPPSVTGSIGVTGEPIVTDLDKVALSFCFSH